MGCDIHCVIEYKNRELTGDSWVSFGYNSLNPGRDYTWFANLAGVRGNPKSGVALASGFGIPENPSYTTRSETTVAVTDENRAHAERWITSGMSSWADWSKDLQGKPTRVTHPDWHSHGWCNVEAWKKSTRGRKTIMLKCMNAIIDTLVRNKYEVRIVFWFDN